MPLAFGFLCGILFSCFSLLWLSFRFPLLLPVRAGLRLWVLLRVRRRAGRAAGCLWCSRPPARSQRACLLLSVCALPFAVCPAVGGVCPCLARRRLCWRSLRRGVGGDRRFLRPSLLVCVFGCRRRCGCCVACALRRVGGLCAWCGRSGAERPRGIGHRAFRACALLRRCLVGSRCAGCPFGRLRSRLVRVPLRGLVRLPVVAVPPGCPSLFVVVGLFLWFRLWLLGNRRLRLWGGAACGPVRCPPGIPL